MTAAGMLLVRPTRNSMVGDSDKPLGVLREARATVAPTAAASASGSGWSAAQRLGHVAALHWQAVANVGTGPRPTDSDSLAVTQGARGKWFARHWHDRERVAATGCIVEHWPATCQVKYGLAKAARPRRTNGLSCADDQCDAVQCHCAYHFYAQLLRVVHGQHVGYWFSHTTRTCHRDGYDRSRSGL